MRLTEAEFLDHVADHLADLPGVRAVSLGGSRAEGNHRSDSDWDFAVYYRGSDDGESVFRPEMLRDLVGRESEWDGQVSELGEWSPGVFNGGAWLRIGDRPVDLHYRDLDVVERELDRAHHGEFGLEPLMFHLVGIPTYLVIAELALNRVLRGELPRPEYPVALRSAASELWWRFADLGLTYARANHAVHGRLAETAGALAQASAQAAHAVLARRGRWVTNDKRLLERAGLRRVDSLLAGAAEDPQALLDLVDATRELLESVVQSAKDDAVVE